MNGERGVITGRKVLLIAVAAFGVVIAANLALLFSATGTFPGLVVKNSYVASQNWNRTVAAQRATGWQVSVGYETGALGITVGDRDGAPVPGLDVSAVIGRPASQAGDRRLALTERDGRYVADLDLAPGLWRVEIEAAGGTDRVSVSGEFLVSER